MVEAKVISGKGFLSIVAAHGAKGGPVGLTNPENVLNGDLDCQTLNSKNIYNPESQPTYTSNLKTGM